LLKKIAFQKIVSKKTYYHFILDIYYKQTAEILSYFSFKYKA